MNSRTHREMRTVAAVVFSLAGFGLRSGPAAATIRSVPADFATIQAALDVSTFGDVVLVTPGTYHENLVFSSAHNGVRLASAAGPELTTIDGGRLGRVAHFSGVGSLTVIEGFTLANGGEATPSDLVGGGILTFNCSPTIRGNVIRGNRATAAGGIYVDGGAPLIANNRILENEATGGSGGGVYFDHYAAGIFEGNVVARNISDAWGGGITIWEGARPNLVRNSIVGNQAAIEGGGIYIERNSHPTCTANIVAFNPTGGGIVVQDWESTKVVECGDVYGNHPANYVGLADPTGADGNISADPLFCDLQSGDYGLTSLSPCSTPFAPSGCSQIGALEVACSPTAVTRSTWGGIKARYRGDQDASASSR